MAHEHTVAVLWHAASTSPFLISGGATGWCRLAWIVDGSDEATAGFFPLLRRSGAVLDTAVLDEDALAAELEALGTGGIMVLDDPPIALAARLAQRLGLRFHDPETGLRLTDKVRQRAALAAAGVPSAAYAAISPGDPVPTHVPLPAVLKPRSGASSRDVVMVRTTEELAERLAVMGDEPMMLEEFLGPRADNSDHESGVVSVESTMVDGEVHHIGVTGRFPIAPPFLETGTYHPWEGVGVELEAVVDVAAAAARALGVRDGFLHTELKRTPDGPRVVEVNGRLGGQVPEMTQRAGGGDLVRQVMRLSLGLPLEDLPQLPGVGFVLWGQVPPEASNVVSVEGVEEVRALPGCTDTRLQRRPGDHVDVREGSLGAVWAVHGSAPDHDAMVRTREEILALIRVETR